VVPNEKWLGFVLIGLAIYVFIIFGFKRERRPLNIIGISPIVWIILGSFFLIGGGVAVWHGFNLAWPPAKNEPTNSQGLSKEELRHVLKEELEKLLPHDPETMHLKNQAANAIAQGKIDEAEKLIKNVKIRTQQEFRDHFDINF